MVVTNMILAYYVRINNRVAIKTNCHIRIEVHRDADIRTESAELIGCHQVRDDGDRDYEYGSVISLAYVYRVDFSIISMAWGIPTKSNSEKSGGVISRDSSGSLVLPIEA